MKDDVAAARYLPKIRQIRRHVVQLELERPEFAVPRLPGDVLGGLRALVLPAARYRSGAAAPVGVRELRVRRAYPDVGGPGGVRQTLVNRKD